MAGDARFVVSRSPRAARLLRELRARAGAGARRRRVRGARRPGRRRGTPTSSRRCSARSATHGSSTATRGSSPRRRGRLRHLLGASGATTTRDLLSLLVANAVTGAASLFPRELLDFALPFPPAQFDALPRPLDRAGRARAGRHRLRRPAALRLRPARRRRRSATPRRTGSPELRDRARPACAATRASGSRRGGSLYFGDVCRLDAVRDDPAAALRRRDARRQAARARALLRTPTAPRCRRSALARAALRELAGRPRDARRRDDARLRVRLAAGCSRPPRATARARACASTRVPPPDLGPRPGARRPAAPGPRMIAEKIAPLELSVRDDAPAAREPPDPDDRPASTSSAATSRSSTSPAGSPSAALRVRVVTVDPVPPLPRSWRQQVEAYSGLAGLFDRVEVEFGRESPGLEVSRADRFVATHLVDAPTSPRDACAELGGERFLYLIQEYEPFTFPMGTLAALADESYRLPPPRAVLDRAPARLLPPPRHRRLRGRAGAGDAPRRRSRTRSRRCEPPTAAELAGAQHAPAAVLRAARAARRAQHVRARPARASAARSSSGAFAGWELHGIGDGRAAAGASTSAAGARSSSSGAPTQGELRRPAARRTTSASR